MLLIAEPKSASTSLLFSIAQILKIPPKNGQNHRPGDKKCSGYTNIQIYHNTTVQRTYKFLKKYIEGPNIIYKEHILPTKEHIESIISVNKPVVILLRDTESILKSYSRIFDVLPSIKERINMKTLGKELDLFYKTYKTFETNKNFLIVEYKDIVLNFSNKVYEILKHYGYPKTKKQIEKFTLLKKNYSGYGLKDLKAQK